MIWHILGIGLYMLKIIASCIVIFLFFKINLTMANSSIFLDLLNQQKLEFSNFTYPENISFVFSDGADIHVAANNEVIIPSKTSCTNQSVKIQVTHELGHIVFSEKFKTKGSRVATDYALYLSLQKKRERLFLLYDKIPTNSPTRSHQMNTLNAMITSLNKEQDKLSYIPYLVFPLEEMFSDLYSVIYYGDSKIISKALLCYGVDEALKRDYSKKMNLSFTPSDPYGHTDYMFFANHFINTDVYLNSSANENLDRLFNRIHNFSTKYLELNKFKDFNYKAFNLELIKNKYDDANL